MTATTGFSITCEFYNSSANRSSGGTFIRSTGVSATKYTWQRLFDLSDGTIYKWFMINAGGEPGDNHMQVSANYSEVGSANNNKCSMNQNKDCYNVWHTLTLDVTKDSKMYLYIDGTLVSSHTAYSDVLNSVLNNLSSFGTCYIGTSVYEASGSNADGFFTGKIRNYTFINTGDVFTISYKTGTSETINNVVSAFIPDELPVPKTVPTGFTFEGWYTDETYTNKAVAGKFVDENTTLYAKFVHTETDGTSYCGTSTLPPYFAEGDWNWALMNDIVSGTTDKDVNLCLNGHKITTLTQTAGTLSVSDCSANKTGAVTTFNQTGGSATLTAIPVTAATIKGTGFTLDGLVKIGTLTLGSGNVITFGEDISSGSEINLSSACSGLITSGFGNTGFDLGQVIFLSGGDTKNLLVKNKSGEIKITGHKSIWKKD